MQGASDACAIRVAVAGPRPQGDDRRSREGVSFGSVHFGLLLNALKRARLWGRVHEVAFACERWLGPVRVLP